MIVTCPNCQTRYNLPDDKIPEGGAKVKCSKCAHVFKAEAPPASPEDEVENLLEEESQAAPDTQAGDDSTKPLTKSQPVEKNLPTRLPKKRPHRKKNHSFHRADETCRAWMISSTTRMNS